MRTYLETAREATCLTSQRPVEVYHLLTRVVRDVHVKGPTRSTTLSVATACVLLGKVDLLTHRVHHFVFVFRLKSCNINTIWSLIQALTFNQTTQIMMILWQLYQKRKTNFCKLELHQRPLFNGWSLQSKIKKVS